ncbi:MAG: hypothetical protein WC529_05620 [Candidatus Margulisiibacteriota bacterium]
MSIYDISRQLRLSIAPKLDIGYETFNYGSAGGSLYVPANPDDPGAESQPVNANDFNTFEAAVGFDVKLDFLQWAYLKYQLAWDGTTQRTDINHDEYGCKPYTEGSGETSAICTGKPVPNETPYAVGAGATFASASEGGPGIDDPSLMQSVTVGYYPLVYQTAGPGGLRERSVAFEAGVATKNYTVTRGWVRDGIVEIRDKEEYDLFGATWGIYYHDLRLKGDKDSYFGGVSFGLKGTHFIGNSHVFAVEMSVPFGLGWQI